MQSRTSASGRTRFTATRRHPTARSPFVAAGPPVAAAPVHSAGGDLATDGAATERPPAGRSGRGGRRIRATGPGWAAHRLWATSRIGATALGVSVAVALAACGSDSGGSSGSSGSDGTGAASRAPAAAAPTGTPIKIGQIVPIESNTVNLRTFAAGSKAAVDGINRRGGLNGHPLQLIQCDGKADPNRETSCAREMVDKGVVATVGDGTFANAADVVKILSAAGIARVGLFPGSAEYACDVCFPQNGGNAGLFGALALGLLNHGDKKLVLIRPDVPSAAELVKLIKPLVEHNGGKLVEDIPVAGTTTDYSQFILKARSAGADGAIVGLSIAQTPQLLTAASQLNSDIDLSIGAGSMSAEALDEFSDLDGLLLTDSVPSITASESDFPGLKQVKADFAATGDSALDPDKVTSAEVRGYVAVLGFTQTMKAAGSGDITAASVLSTMRTAKDVDMLGLMKPWTPNYQAAIPTFTHSWPFYYTGTFTDGKIKSDPKPFDVFAAF